MSRGGDGLDTLPGAKQMCVLCLVLMYMLRILPPNTLFRAVMCHEPITLVLVSARQAMVGYGMITPHGITSMDRTNIERTSHRIDRTLEAALTDTNTYSVTLGDTHM